VHPPCCPPRAWRYRNQRRPLSQLVGAREHIPAGGIQSSAAYVQRFKQIAPSHASCLLWERWKSSHPVGVGYQTPFRTTRSRPNTQICGVDRLSRTPHGIFDLWGAIRPAIVLRHHLAHAASTYFTSPFQNAAILSYDGEGDWNCRGCLAVGYKRVLEPHEFFGPRKVYKRDFAVGIIWEIVAKALFGMSPADGPGKLMALAAYGSIKKEWVPRLRALLKHFPGGEFEGPELVLSQPWGFSTRNRKRAAPFEGHETGELAQAFVRTLQYATQKETTTEIGRFLRFIKRQRTKDIDGICIAGGCGLNGGVNSEIRSAFGPLHIPPFTSDSGLAVGSALFAHNFLHRRNSRSRTTALSPYLGRTLRATRIEINEAVAIMSASSETEVRFLPSITEATANFLSNGNVIGWLQGRSESGPRALGNRSLLVDPGNEKAVQRLAKHVKRREWYRPFSPSITKESAGEYFEIPEEGSPYMLLFCRAFAATRRRFPSIVHVDGSSRVQTVTATVNPLFHALLEAFGHITGYPMLLNTSFNSPGEPVVDTCLDAVRILLASNLDGIVCGSFLICRHNSPLAQASLLPVDRFHKTACGTLD